LHHFYNIDCVELGKKSIGGNAWGVLVMGVLGDVGSPGKRRLLVDNDRD
jgi:hypothetical protein